MKIAVDSWEKAMLLNWRDYQTVYVNTIGEPLEMSRPHQAELYGTKLGLDLIRQWREESATISFDRRRDGC